MKSTRNTHIVAWWMAFMLGILFSVGAHARPVGKFETLTTAQIESTYYFDWNRNTIFRASVNGLFKKSKLTMPSWIRQGAGPSAPSKVVPNGAVNWVIVNTCKQGDCGNNLMYVAFDPATRAGAAVAKLDGALTWIGNPNPTVKQVLSQQSGWR